MWIDIYDFDGTIFRGDSTRAFWLYCLRKKPALVKFLPRQIAALFMMACKRWDLTRGKGAFLCFVRDIDFEAMAEGFWAEPRIQRRMEPWFGQRDEALPTVIASASPEALLAPIARKYGVEYLIGTRIDLRNGKLTSTNCKGQEKVKRLCQVLPEGLIRAMYTDDRRADGPLLALAQQRYIVRRGVVKREW
ncbi:MAG: HAD-IB family phosphatase [Clostridia bacterium]|nr:HAD-IB family phosphatase [Clostridia bacterium]